MQLEPCPFCGGEAEIIHIEEGENAGGSCVCCTRCNASGNVEFGFKENYVSNWNRRVERDALRPSPSDIYGLLCEWASRGDLTCERLAPLSRAIATLNKSTTRDETAV